jgi:hypothetical protein
MRLRVDIGRTGKEDVGVLRMNSRAVGHQSWPIVIVGAGIRRARKDLMAGCAELAAKLYGREAALPVQEQTELLEKQSPRGLLFEHQVIRAR